MKTIIFLTLLGVALSTRVHQDTPTSPPATMAPATADPGTAAPATTSKKEMTGPGISGMLASGAGFKASGDTSAGAAADKDSGVAGGSIDGFGSVLGLAGSGFGFGAAIASPSL